MLDVLPGPVSMLLSVLAPFVIRPFLERRNVLDTPNARSSHARPVVRGGGLGVVFAIVVCLVGTLLISGEVARYGTILSSSWPLRSSAGGRTIAG